MVIFIDSGISYLLNRTIRRRTNNIRKTQSFKSMVCYDEYVAGFFFFFLISQPVNISNSNQSRTKKWFSWGDFAFSMDFDYILTFTMPVNRYIVLLWVLPIFAMIIHSFHCMIIATNLQHDIMCFIICIIFLIRSIYWYFKIKNKRLSKACISFDCQIHVRLSNLMIMLRLSV